MIVLINGGPGAGKSYEATSQHIVPALLRGRKVITNIPFSVQHMKRVYPDFDESLIEVLEPTSEHPIRFLSVSDYESEWKHPEKLIGPLFVIDECHNALPRDSRDKEILRWYTMHRHTGSDVVLITQQVSQMRRDIPGLAETVYILKKNRNLGSSRTYRRIIKDGLKGETISTAICTYNKKYFGFYQSQTLGGSAEAQPKHKPIWFRWPFVGAAIFAVLFVALSFRSGLTPWQRQPSEVSSAPTRVSAPADTDALQVQPPRSSISVPEERIQVTPRLFVPKPEPVVPEALDGNRQPRLPGFDPRLVTHVDWVRLGNKCAAFVHVTGRKLAVWEIAQAGWTVDVGVHDGAAKEDYGSCSLAFTREIGGELVTARYFMNPLAGQTLEGLAPLDDLPVRAPLDILTPSGDTVGRTNPGGSDDHEKTVDSEQEGEPAQVRLGIPSEAKSGGGS